MLDTHGRKYVQPIFDRIAMVLINMGLSPVRITIIAFVIGMGAVITLLFGQSLIAVILLWLSGLFDVLDGTVARKLNQSSNLGAFLDITFDRIVELGLIVALVSIQPELGQMLVFLTASIVLSMTIFLTVGNFAKNSTKKSFYYQAGVAERTEGFILFTAMMLLPQYRMYIGYIFAGMILFTACQRFMDGIRILKNDETKDRRKE